MIRSQIINEGVRADGRGLAQVRPIWIETNILPNAHGSCLFTRGQTQALVVATLGSDADAQLSDLLTQNQPFARDLCLTTTFRDLALAKRV